MSRYVAITPVAGIGDLGLGYAPDTTRRRSTGYLLDAQDRYWGAARFIYGKAGGTIPVFALCEDVPAYDSTLLAIDHVMQTHTDTANTGWQLCVAMSDMTVGQYGWFMLSGMTPVRCDADVAANTKVGTKAAGLGGAIGNGKQVLGARSILSSTTTKTMTGTANASSNILNVVSSDGVFVGSVLSGTGIGTDALVSAISADGKTITMSVNTTAGINGGTITATYTNGASPTVYYNIWHINNPIGQGQTT